MRVFNASLVLLVALSACQGSEPAPQASLDRDPPQRIDELRPTLELSAVPQGDSELAVTLQYNRAVDREGPRVAEIFIAHAEGLSYRSATALGATQAAGKSLVVQQPEPDLLRIIIYAANNLERIDSGPLASLIFERRDNVPAWLELRRDPPPFAPPEANLGLRLGETLTIGGEQ